jgi:prepilin-type N-terminal cleavage/methylation domain-containing protein
MKSIKKNNKGFSLIEILVAIAVIALVGSSVLSGFVQAARINARSKQMQEATDLAQITAEKFNANKLSDLLTTYLETDQGINKLTITLVKEDGTEVPIIRQSATTNIDGTEAVSANENTRKDIQAKLDAVANTDYKVQISNLPKVYITSTVSSPDDIPSTDYTVDVTLSSGQYSVSDAEVSAGTSEKITTTYNQQFNIKQGDKVVLNDFIVPDIRETNDNLVISASDYNDTAAITDYKDYAANYYAAHKIVDTSLPNYAALYQQKYDSFFSYLESNIFKNSRIGIEAYNITISGVSYSNCTIEPERTLKVKLTCSKQPVSVDPTGQTYTMTVTLTGVYKFKSYTYDGITIPSTTITQELLTDASGKSFDFNLSSGSASDMKSVYFYFNPTDQAHGYFDVEKQAELDRKKLDGLAYDSINPFSLGFSLPSYDKITLDCVYGSGVDPSNTSLQSRLAESGFYLVTQNFQIGSTEYTPIFNDATFSISTTNRYAGFPVYSNLMKKSATDNGVTLCNIANASGYLTDGNQNSAAVYGMEISVKRDGREFANIQTLKEE